MPSDIGRVGAMVHCAAPDERQELYKVTKRAFCVRLRLRSMRVVILLKFD